jgi:CHASE3 domain sensor protein
VSCLHQSNLLLLVSIDSDEHLQQYFDKFVSQMRDFKQKLEAEQAKHNEAAAKLSTMSGMILIRLFVPYFPT